MTDSGAVPTVSQRGGAVVIQGAALELVYRAVLALMARHHRDGMASTPLLHDIRSALYSAMSARGHELDEPPSFGACCACQGVDDLIDTTEAARLLSVSSRQVTRLAAQSAVLGTRIGNAWVLRRAPTLALAQARREAAE